MFCIVKVLVKAPCNLFCFFNNLEEQYQLVITKSRSEEEYVPLEK